MWHPGSARVAASTAEMFLIPERGACLDSNETVKTLDKEKMLLAPGGYLSETQNPVASTWRIQIDLQFHD